MSTCVYEAGHNHHLFALVVGVAGPIGLSILACGVIYLRTQWEEVFTSSIERYSFLVVNDIYPFNADMTSVVLQDKTVDYYPSST